MPRPENIEDVILEIHAGDGKGQWFTWTDSKNKIYDNFVVIDDSKEKPTEEFLESELVRLQAEWDAQDYSRNRQAEYPPIGDQLDALFHAGVFPADMAAQLQAVKDKYPND
jgi:hypothetical protein